MLKVDGGGTANAFLMQFQADLLGVPVEVAAVQETTALGAAYLAGLGVGLWADLAELAQRWRSSRRYEPRMSADRARIALHRAGCAPSSGTRLGCAAIRRPSEPSRTLRATLMFDKTVLAQRPAGCQQHAAAHALGQHQHLHRRRLALRERR